MNRLVSLISGALVAGAFLVFAGCASTTTGPYSNLYDRAAKQRSYANTLAFRKALGKEMKLPVEVHTNSYYDYDPTSWVVTTEELNFFKERLNVSGNQISIGFGTIKVIDY